MEEKAKPSGSSASTLQKPVEPTASLKKDWETLLRSDFAKSLLELEPKGPKFDSSGFLRMTSTGARSGRFSSQAPTSPKPFSLKERLEDIWAEADAKRGVQRKKVEVQGRSAELLIIDEIDYIPLDYNTTYTISEMDHYKGIVPMSKLEQFMVEIRREEEGQVYYGLGKEKK